MTMRLFKLCACSLVIVLAAGNALQAADWGTLKGHFVCVGKPPVAPAIDVTKDQDTCGKCKLVDERVMVSEKGDVANVVIFLRNKNPKVAPSYDKTAKDNVEFDNHCCRFTPHVQLLRTTQTLVIKNSDPIGHNTNITGLVNPGGNQLIPSMDKITMTFPNEEALPIGAACNIHPWMKGYIVVRSNPYMAVSDEKGNFTIKDMPANTELEFQLWQEKAGYLQKVTFKGGASDTKGRFKIKLTGSETDLGDMKVPAADFNK